MRRKHRRTIPWLLSVTMTLTLLPSLAFCQPMVAPEMIVDLGYITPDTVAAVVAYPRYVLSHPAMEMLPVEVITGVGGKRLRDRSDPGRAALGD